VSTLEAPSAGAPPLPAVRPLPPVLVIAAVLVHIPLGLAMHASPGLARGQALLALAAVVWTLLAARTPGPIVAAAGYVAGCEVLWRMTQAGLPWEISKYLLVVIFAVGIFRFVGHLERWAVVGVFVACLLPAAVIPVLKLGVVGAVDPISFNLGGLFALAVGVLFLSRVAGPWGSMTPTLWAFVAPVLGVAAIATNGVRTLGVDDFFNDSNFLSSGGYGPNQVSAVLGLAALFLVFLAFRERVVTLQVTCLVLALWLTSQAMLTFSRGGVVNLAVALLVAVPFLLRRRDSAVRVVAVGAAFAAVFLWVILPRLDSFTGGALDHRFSRGHEAERRAELIAKDFETFRHHPGLGVGVGQSEYYRIEPRLIASHTEYTRLLAEHGVLGILAMACLLLMVWKGFRRQVQPFGQAWTAALVAWTALELSHSSTRLAAIALTFALAQFAVVDEPRPPVPERAP